jgi:prepilin-type N-terminal cleavage/methylation domain-containing protein
VAPGGFTLMEVLVAGAIGSIIGLISIGGMVEGLHLFKSNATEMIARDQGSRAVRKMSADIQQSLLAQIYPNYQGTTGAEGQYGSCVVLQTSSGVPIAYYRYAATSDPNSGGIYYSANAAVAPNPLTDKLLVTTVQDLEFRRDVNGSIRVGFDIGTFGFPTLVVGGKEADLVRFTTSSLPRN